MKGMINAIKWEAILDFKEYLRYRIGLLMDFIIFTGTFIVIYFMGINEGFASFYNTNANTGNVLVLIGYIFWQNAVAALGYCTATISSELSQGIFEMRLQSKFSVSGILFFRLLVSCFIHLVTYVGVFGFSFIVIDYHIRDLYAIILAIIISFPALLGMYGIGLIFGGICICEKKVGSLIIVVQTVLLLVTNTLSPSRSAWIYIIPFAAGIDIVRDLYLGNSILYGDIIIYIFVNVLWFIIGNFCFKRALNYEKKYGTFDSY